MLLQDTYKGNLMSAYSLDEFVTDCERQVTDNALLSDTVHGIATSSLIPITTPATLCLTMRKPDCLCTHLSGIRDNGHLYTIMAPGE